MRAVLAALQPVIYGRLRYPKPSRFCRRVATDHLTKSLRNYSPLSPRWPTAGTQKYDKPSTGGLRDFHTKSQNIKCTTSSCSAPNQCWSNEMQGK